MLLEGTVAGFRSKEFDSFTGGDGRQVPGGTNRFVTVSQTPVLDGDDVQVVEVKISQKVWAGLNGQAEQLGKVGTPVRIAVGCIGKAKVVGTWPDTGKPKYGATVEYYARAIDVPAAGK